MKLLDVLTAAGARCSGGDPYQWDCYGPNALNMEFRDVKGNGYSHCVYDTNTYEVYEIHVETPVVEKDIPLSALRWINPQWVLALKAESESRGEDLRFAWDDVLYDDVLDEAEILKHLVNVGNGIYDNLPVAKREDPPDTMEYEDTDVSYMFMENESVQDEDIFTVALDVKYTFEVLASSHEEAVNKAKEFRKTMPSGWGDVEGVSWMDTEVVKETISREISE